MVQEDSAKVAARLYKSRDNHKLASLVKRDVQRGASIPLRLLGD